MIKYRFNIFVLIIIAFTLISCSNIPKKTESGKELSNSFSNVFNTLDLTRDFYFQTKDLVVELDKKGYLSREDQETIIKYALVYKRLHRESKDLLKDWYRQVNQGKEVTVKSLVIERLFALLENGEHLNQLVMSMTDNEFSLPVNLIPNAVELTKLLVDLPE